MAAVAKPENLTQIIALFTDIGLKLIPFMGALAFLSFVFGVVRFIKAAGNEKEIKESKNFLIWGVIGMFVLVTIWGIVTFLRGEVGFTGDIGIPQIKF